MKTRAGNINNAFFLLSAMAPSMDRKIWAIRTKQKTHIPKIMMKPNMALGMPNISEVRAGGPTIFITQKKDFQAMSTHNVRLIRPVTVSMTC